MDFQSLKRRDLQTLCKKNKIPANTTNVAMADALQSLEFVEGLEEILKQSESETPESPEKVGISLNVPRTSTRRKTTKEEPESSKLATRSCRGTATIRINVEESIADQENKDVSETPAVAKSARRKAPMGGSTRKKIVTETPQTRGKSEVRTHVYSTRRSARMLEMKMRELSLEEKQEEPSVLKGNELEAEYSMDYLEEKCAGGESKTTDETEASETVSCQSLDALLENEKGCEQEGVDKSEHDEVGMKAELEVAGNALDEIDVDEIVDPHNEKQCKGDKMQETSEAGDQLDASSKTVSCPSVDALLENEKGHEQEDDADSEHDEVGMKAELEVAANALHEINAGEIAFYIEKQCKGDKLQEISEVVDEVDRLDDDMSNGDSKEEVHNKKGSEQLSVILFSLNTQNLTEQLASKSKLDTEIVTNITLESSDISEDDGVTIAPESPEKPDNCSDPEKLRGDSASADQDKDQEEYQSPIGEIESEVACELSKMASSQVLQSDKLDEDLHDSQSDRSESALEVTCELKGEMVSTEAQQRDNVDMELEKFQSDVNGPAVTEDTNIAAAIPIDVAAQSFGKQMECGAPYEQVEVNDASVNGNPAQEGTPRSVARATLYCLAAGDVQKSGCVDSIMEFGVGMGTKYSETALTPCVASVEIVPVATVAAAALQSTEKASDSNDFEQPEARGNSRNMENETSSMSLAELALSLNGTVSDNFENYINADGGVGYPKDKKFVDHVMAVDMKVDNETIPGDLVAGHVDVGYADLGKENTENNSPHSQTDDQAKLCDLGNENTENNWPHSQTDDQAKLYDLGNEDTENNSPHSQTDDQATLYDFKACLPTNASAATLQLVQEKSASKSSTSAQRIHFCDNNMENIADEHIDADGGSEHPEDRKFVDQLMAVDIQVPRDLVAGYVDVANADLDSKNLPNSHTDVRAMLYDPEACLPTNASAATIQLVQEGITHSITPLKSASKSSNSARKFHVFDDNKENIAINTTKEPEIKFPTTKTGTPLDKKSLGWLRKQFKSAVEEEKKRKALQAVSDNCFTAGDLAKEKT